MVHIVNVIPELILDVNFRTRFGIYVYIKQSIILPKYFGNSYVIYVDNLMLDEKVSKYEVCTNNGINKIYLEFSNEESRIIDKAIIDCVIDNLTLQIKVLTNKADLVKKDIFLQNLVNQLASICLRLSNIEDSISKLLLINILSDVNTLFNNIRKHFLKLEGKENNAEILSKLT